LGGDWGKEAYGNMDLDDKLVTFQTGKGNDHLDPVIFPLGTHSTMLSE